MGADLPWLDVRSPAGKWFHASFTSARFTIGRPPGNNDLSLRDPLVSRLHCRIELDTTGEGGWQLYGEGQNGTFVRRPAQKGRDECVGSDAPWDLKQDDVIVIPGIDPSTGDERYWELTFHSSQDTLPSTGDRRRLLTETERMILQRICKGMAGKQIARDLNVAESTVDVHRTNIFRKLNVFNQVEACNVARQRGEI